MNRFRKVSQLALSLSLILVLFMGMVPVKADETEDQRFEQWMMDEWVETMESDYLNMHFSVKDYRAYGIEKPEVTLGTINKEDYQEAVTECQETMAEMEAFNYDALSYENQVSYDVYHFYLEQMAVLNAYPEFEEMFNPYNGYLTNAVTNFTEFVFYEKEDIEDYLTLIADYPRLIGEMWTFTEEQAKEGYFMPDVTLDEALTEIQEFVDKGVENPLIVIFSENVDAFEGLTDQEKADYKSRNNEIVINQVLPAYTDTASKLETLRGSRQNDLGICGYPGGEAYYEALAKYQSSISMSPEEMYDFCEEAMDNLIPYYRKIYSKYGGSGETADVSFESAEEILDYLSTHLSAFPQGPDVKYTASYLDKSIENPSIVAYYLTPPLDEITNNVIKINGSLTEESMTDLYMTLSHEGYPGHLYQFTWYMDKNPAPLRCAVSVMGYQEGWAMYVENLLIRESGLDEFSYTDAEVNNYYGYVYNALMEIGINGLGWTVDDFLDFLNADGPYYTMEDAQDIYDNLRSMPGTMLAYGFGDAYFMTLRAMTQKAMGQYFDEVAFHEVLLKNGPRQFEIIRQDLERYIASQGYKVPTTYKAYEIELNGVPQVEKGEPVPEDELSEIEYQTDEEYEGVYPDPYQDPGASMDELFNAYGGGSMGDLIPSSVKTMLIIGPIVGLLVVAGGIIWAVIISKKYKH
ncbi:MAG: DUF885 domain-containing protein [Firmicutes bacterium]|nr:DUF885 domain-containing protein [Bacillota bacterium]